MILAALLYLLFMVIFGIAGVSYFFAWLTCGLDSDSPALVAWYMLYAMIQTIVFVLLLALVLVPAIPVSTIGGMPLW